MTSRVKMPRIFQNEFFYYGAWSFCLNEKKSLFCAWILLQNWEKILETSIPANNGSDWVKNSSDFSSSLTCTKKWTESWLFVVDFPYVFTVRKILFLCLGFFLFSICDRFLRLMSYYIYSANLPRNQALLKKKNSIFVECDCFFRRRESCDIA